MDHGFSGSGLDSFGSGQCPVAGSCLIISNDPETESGSHEIETPVKI
jgi:hypothetical protein